MAIMRRSLRMQSSGKAAPLYRTIPPASTAGRNFRSDGSLKASRTLGREINGEAMGADERRTLQLEVPERISGP